MIGALTFDRLIELRDKGFRLQEIGLPIAANISFPGHFMTTGPTSDIKVRQALSYAINRQEMCDTFYNGLAKPGGWWFFSEQTWGWDGSLKSDPYDPARARQLLQEAGYPDRFNPKAMPIYTTATQAELMQILQGYWQAVGVDTDVQILDTPAWSPLFFVRAKEPTDKQVGSIIPWVFGSFYNNVYHSANMFTDTGVHTTSNDPKATEMYQAAIAELDESKAKRQWQELMQYAYETMWVNVPLVNVPTYMVLGPNVGEFTINKNLILSDAYVGITRKA
jgi:ABC-type transport system substrate-binding protein